MSRQLLLLGAVFDFSDFTNRNVGCMFVHELLHHSLEHETDDEGNEIIIGDGINLGGDHEWAKAVSELAKNVHASAGEFEEKVSLVIDELARPCRERTADFMQWMNCLSVVGFLLENITSFKYLVGKVMEPAEILHSLLVAGVSEVKHLQFFFKFILFELYTITLFSWVLYRQTIYMLMYAGFL